MLANISFIQYTSLYRNVNLLFTKERKKEAYLHLSEQEKPMRQCIKLYAEEDVKIFLV